MRIGTKSLLGCRSSRLVSGLITSWALDLHHPTLGCADLQTQHLLRHPAFPLVHQLFSVRPLDNFYYDLLFISAYADLMLRMESPWNTRLQELLLFIDVGLGATHLGGNLALRAGGRRQSETRWRLPDKEVWALEVTQALRRWTRPEEPYRSWFKPERLLRRGIESWRLQ